MSKQTKNKNSWFFIAFQILFLAFLLVLVLILYSDGQLTFNNLIIIMVLIFALSIPVIISVKNKLSKEPEQSVKAQPSGDNLMQAEVTSESQGPDSSIPSNPTLAASPALAQQIKNKALMKKISAIIPILVIIFCVWYVYSNGSLGLFNASPEGKWYQYVDPDSCGSGVTCVTEYWYLEFDANGTYDIGWKNPGYNEESQGGGTWTKSGSRITISGTVGGMYSTGTMVIKGNKMYAENDFGGLDPNFFEK